MYCHGCWTPHPTTAARCGRCGVSFESAGLDTVDLYLTGFQSAVALARYTEFVASRAYAPAADGTESPGGPERLPALLLKGAPADAAASLAEELADLGVRTYARRAPDADPAPAPGRADPSPRAGRYPRARAALYAALGAAALASAAVGVRSVAVHAIDRAEAARAPVTLRGTHFPMAIPAPNEGKPRAFRALPFDDAGRRAAAWSDQGRAALAAGDPEGALRHFETALLEAPEGTAIRRNAGIAAIARGRRDLAEGAPAEAVPWFRTAAEIDPAGAAGPRWWGEALRRAGDSEGAARVLREAIARDPTDLEARRLLAESLFDLHDLDGAAAALVDLARRAPESVATAGHLRKIERERRTEAGARVLEVGGFRITFAPSFAERQARAILTALARARATVDDLYRFQPKTSFAVGLYPDTRFRSVAPSPEWTGALYDGRIRLRAGTVGEMSEDELARTLAHEYTHAVVDRLSAGRAPAWLSEGLALLASEPNPFNRHAVFGHIARVRGHQVFALEDLERSLLGLDEERARLAYNAAFNVASYIVETYGYGAVRGLLGAYAEGEGSREAIERVLGVPYDDFEGRFRLHALTWKGRTH